MVQNHYLQTTKEHLSANSINYIVKLLFIVFLIHERFCALLQGFQSIYSSVLKTYFIIYEEYRGRTADLLTVTHVLH